MHCQRLVRFIRSSRRRYIYVCANTPAILAAPKSEDDFTSDRDYGRRDRDYGSSRRTFIIPLHRCEWDANDDLIAAERSFPSRDELPMPTAPPYTAFVGNLPFDLTEGDLGDFFAPSEVRCMPLSIRD